jgi:hypothetical protein
MQRKHFLGLCNINMKLYYKILDFRRVVDVEY